MFRYTCIGKKQPVNRKAPCKVNVRVAPSLYIQRNYNTCYIFCLIMNTWQSFLVVKTRRLTHLMICMNAIFESPIV